jgi:xylulokinase
MAITQRQLVRRVTASASADLRGQRIVATGGGARSAVWLQITADVLGVPVVRASCPEPACLGAAAFAAVAAGIQPTIPAAAQAMVRVERVFEPAPGAVSRYRDVQP